MIILMLVGLVLRASAADVKYYIVNNDGKICFQYVIRNNITYEDEKYKTELWVHPWARSVIATNFRFYVTKAEAVADANGTVGSFFTEGTSIVTDPESENYTGPGPFYVRYSMKTADELASEGFVYDPNGNMTYFMQIRERDDSKKKAYARRRQVYYDTTDKRFEFGYPGEKNTDIPDPDPAVDGGGEGNLQTALQYRFRVVSSDPYNSYFYNGAGEGENVNGVLTVSDISRNNDKKAKERVTYEDKIANYDPETTTTLQSFFFVAASPHILQSDWSSEYIGKMFVVGAVGGKDYYMRDVSSGKATGNDEANVPYMLVANGSTGTFNDPGYQLQCYQSWRNYDYTKENTSLVLMTPYENTHLVTYHIVNSADKSKDVLTIEQRHGPHSQFKLSYRDKLQRLGCTLSTDYYSDRECTTSAFALVGDATDVYIPYTFDAAGTTTATNLVFSTEENPVWFSMDIRENGNKLLTYDATNNVIDSRYAPTDAKRILQESQFAFIGDPYSFRVICKGADGKIAYLDPESITVNGSTAPDNVRFTSSPTDDMDCWAMVAGTTSNSFQIFQRDAYAVTKRAFWDALGGGGRIRMWTQTGNNAEIYNSSNLHVTPTPTYNYIYNIVDNKGNVAIRYTINQDVNRSLVGEHGHKAIPSAIYSPYIEGEELTFYTTFATPGDLTTLSGEIDKLPSGSSNIYVRYTNTKLSTRRYLLDGSKSYFMQLGNKYVIYNSSVATQTERPSVDETGKEAKIWILENSDPYDICIKNSATGNYKLFDNNTNIHFFLMNGANPEDGQIELLFANGLDLSTASNSKSLALNEAAVEEATTVRKNANQQVIFSEAVLERTYRLIDKQGKILLEYESSELPDALVLGVPSKWVSPLVETYHYWARSSFNFSGDTYTLKSGESEITAPTGSTDGYIYVTYDTKANNKIITVIDPTARKHKNDNATEDFVRDYDNWGQIFMIKFADGDAIYQERGDSLRETTMKAIYPYANGDSGFNLYGDTKWDEDRVSASSTRTRWSWYVVSETNDPYRVQITSWQGSHNRKLSGDDVNTAFYNYWRTYYNSAVGTGGSIVTATISDDPQVLDDSKTGGSASNTPTEYMLLSGTEGHYKLVTADEIDGGVAAHDTYGMHRPVKDFLQYWKTYETISRKGVTPKNGTALRYDVFQSQTENPYSYFSAANVTAHPVYKFDAWQNARPITASNPTKSNSKKYEYTYHYYQKISLDEEFNLVEHSIDGIMILLDNHGWEIMRKPMAKTGDANKTSRDADIRKFDSPMVKTYHFWSTATKTTGYHKYTNWKDEKGTGSSLGDYPEVINSNGNISDVYVTYDVKPEYDELYSVTATKDGSGNITALTPAVATDKPFLIRQDGKLGYDNSGTLATDATAATINAIDTGQSLSLGDSYYWYLTPNWDIDKEMGYQYDTGAKTDGKDNEDVNNTSDGLHLPRTQTETEIAYYNTSRIGFDPYNVQIYNKSTGNRYFTTNASDSRLDEINSMKATFTDKNVTLASHHAVNTEVNNGVGHDAVNLHMTNQTFMAVSDANGNLRLMPRFDHYNAIENFIELEDWAADQPVEDKRHGQSTWLIRPTVFTYIVVDSLGREALRYTLISDGSPKIPTIFKSPFAKDFTFWKTLTADDGTHDYDYDLSTLANKISGSFAAAGYTTGGNVYVRYHYDPEADTDGLLKGTWYHAQLNSADVKVTTGGIAKETYADNNAHHWRFMQSAGDIRDPYAVSLYNGSKETESPAVRYILMRHSSGTGYALMQAGTKTTASYSFLDGTSDPTLAAQSNYTTGTAEPFTPAGTIDASKKLTLTPILATNKLTYKIITKSGKVALTSEEVTGITDTYTLKLPEWMESPLMKSDAYLFYSSARDNGDDTFTITSEATTSPMSLDGDVVYVHYDYEKSKKAVENFGMSDLAGLPYNYAPLDLSGKVLYTMGITSSDRGRIWSVDGTTHTISQADVTVNTALTPVARLWRFTGNDPYEVTIQNPSYSETAVLAGKTPADEDGTPAIGKSEKYPLVKMVATDDGTYDLNTFMVLKYNPNEKNSTQNDRHRAGTLKLYVTGEDQLYLAESNSLAGGVYVYKDSKHYKARLADEGGEPLNPVADPEMIIYSSFFYRPVLTYHIITNDKKEALKGYSLMANTTVAMPEIYQSPLLNSSDFTYYTKATVDGSDYTVDKDATTTASTSIATVVAKNVGDIYVRYTYDTSTSPFKIATSIDLDADDGTYLSWVDEKALDLSGKTWYTIADMQRNFTSNPPNLPEHGRVFGVDKDNTARFKTLPVNTLPNGRAPSSKEYLWRLEGNDPYAIKIYSAQHQNYLSVADNSSRTMSLQSDGAVSNIQTFMLLEAHAVDNQVSRLSGYELRRWTVLMTTGTNYFTPCTTTGAGETSNLSARGTWTAPNYSEYQIRMSSDKVVTRKIYSMGGGSTTPYCIEFVKAPVSRKYHYHAVNQATGTVTWDAVLEHDWLQPVVLDEVIARQFCKYEMRDTLATGSTVTGTNTFKTRAELEKKDNAWAQAPNAQFYHDAGLTERVYDAGSNTYDIYPEIGLETVYDIYFKYQIDGTAKQSKRTLSDITSSPEQIADDVAYYGTNGRMDNTYARHANWFFMVLDTDSAITATGTGDTRTFTGNQYFLRREDDGKVSWMNNAYSLHKNDVDNYSEWSYSRIAEWYRKGDNDAYREGRWLWTFVGDDPYNMRIINFESAVGVTAEGYNVYTLAGAENCYTTINKVTTDGVDSYPVTIPTSEPTENQYWGICAGVNDSPEETFSLLSTSITESIDNINVNTPLYWHMVSRTANKVTTESVEGLVDYITGRSYAIQLLPYDPVKYQDINLVIKRDDHVSHYKNTWKPANPSATDDQKKTQLKSYDSGISLLYFTAAERTYVKDDKIDLRTMESLPINLRRAFCDYKLYRDDYSTLPTEDNPYYIVKDGPYPTAIQATANGTWSDSAPYVYTPSGALLYDEDGKPVWTYLNADGTPASGAQSIYVEYEVKSDIFLKEAPTKTQVESMVANNDHVYFMDFPTKNSKSQAITHHAFYDPEATTFIQTGDLSKNKDKNTGIWVPEKKSWSGSAYTSDFTDSYNATQYRTAEDRLVSTPEKLKWYFVGDPYKVQVFNTAGPWNATALLDDADNEKAAANTKQAQLARFNAVETNFQFVSDCVHIRLPDYTKIDNRARLIPTDEYGVAMPEREFPNRNNGKPYINDFYWEVMPSASGEAGTFALRFKEDNELLGYRNVYYYLARDGLTKVYRTQEENPDVYHINLSYYADNERYESGTYLGYHKANNENTAIKLVQPVKVYITTNRRADTRYSLKEGVTKDEYSGYYGLGETITDVPRHLQRKYVEYGDLTDKNGTTMGEHVLSAGNADNAPLADCSAHSSNVFVTGTKINPIFKFSVFYTVDDMTAEGVSLFTPAANATTPTSAELDNITWLDMKISDSSWPYYDKTNLDGSGVENETSRVSNYRRAMYDPKNTGWNNNADGWNDGLKGLHWAFIGDPYDFTILNRRRYEDGTSGSDPMWLGATKQTIADYNGTVPNDSVVWTTCLVNAPTAINTSTATADAAQNTHWSLQMWKLGGDNDFFLRTASLDQTAANEAGTNNTETDKYWRMAARTTTISSNPYEFVAIPYSLDNKNKWTSNVGNLTYNNYVTNGMGYSQTSSGMGVREQLIQIRTATAKDNDKADNNCFDAKVQIRTKKGELRIEKDNMEIKFGIAADMLPYSLRRFGCTYECYINYESPANPGTLLYRLRDSNVPMDETESWSTSQAEYDALNAAVEAAIAAHTADPSKSKNVTLTYVYDMEEEVAPYFTTEANALIDEYTWMNTYFEWKQYYTGTNVEVEYYVDVFDHYVYNAQGQIIDAVYVKERRTKIEKNPTEPYITDAFVNSHSTSTAIYADQSVQTEKDQQKWALVGDPYCFTMINYDQYLKNENSKLTLDGKNVVASNIAKQNFTIAIDTEGNTFLGIFNGTGIDGGGDITHCINFDYSASSDKSLHYEDASVISNNDPTGNTLNTKNIKPFKLADLISYADILQYHLIIAHQHTLDPSDTHLQNLGTDDATVVDALPGDISDATKAKYTSDRQTLRNHFIEYLKYQGIRLANNPADSTYYVNYATTPVTYSTAHATENDIKDMLKKDGSLRDFISYPVVDYNVSRVGIGNHPQVPWYMKRQFCKYYLYQRDVLRSKVSDRLAYLKNDNGEYVDYDGNVVDESERIQLWMDDEHTKPAYEIDWVSIFDISTWNVWEASDGDDVKYTVTTADVEKWGNGLVAGTFRKQPSGLTEAQDLQGRVLTTLQACHKNRKVVIDVVYDVNTDEFQFATSGRNTYAWYQMMTNNASSGLMNFSYKEGVGARTGQATHYTNNYLWAPEGDPYGFVLRSRYATVNGTGWDDVVVTTTGHLPKSTDYTTYDPATIIAGDENAYNATYTNRASVGGIRFDNKLIIHHLGGEELATNDGAANAIYEMFTGDASLGNSFLMHPTDAYMDLKDTEFTSYYMKHDTETHEAKLVLGTANTLKNNAEANWRLATTAEQLWPYFEYAGYVGGLDPVKAQNFSNQELRTLLKEYIDNPSMEREYSVLNRARQLVYSGTFYKKGGEELAATAERPTAAADLPLRFVPENLVPMSAGYYRIQGFSTDKLKEAETASGVYGPRYVSGYRFASEVTNNKPLHYFETNQESATIHTFGDLNTAKGFTDGTLQGNIELQPVEYDPSSIFQFVATGDDFGRWTFGSQDLKVQVVGTPAENTPAATKMSSAAGTAFRLDDIGGATVTLRTLNNVPSNEDVSHTWDSDENYGVSQNIQTNYLTSNGSNNNNAYSLTVAANNELNQTTTTDIQDTKWRLQPVGIRTAWPYNQMPLRVEMKKGGVDKNGAEDKFYYGSLCVPFDSRLGNTTDAAFTMVREITGTSGTITMPSVSQYNGMGNPQYVPATWPVVMRTNQPGQVQMKNADDSNYGGTRYYVDMYLPYTTPQTVSKADLNARFKGEYLERTLAAADFGGAEPNTKTIMVFGLPFKAHTGGDAHVYDDTKRVGFFVNDNWARETYPTDYNANTATDAQRDNKYVYNNKVYYVLDLTYTPPSAREHVIALFDEEEPEDEPIQETVTKKNVPWPCRVYDLQGRLIADKESPETLLINHPSLQPGIYIFGDRKVVVK